MATADVLLIGYGNPGRLDDGLGPALAEAMAALKPEGVTVESNYQLTVEDAEETAHHQVVIFADASVDGAEPFYFRRLEPAASTSFTTHSVEPASILGIRGYEFNEFGEYLSPAAQQNLTLAVRFLSGVLQSGDFEAAAGPLTRGSDPDTIH